MYQFKRFLTSKVPHNKVIWLLTFSDIFTWGSYYVMSSLAGLYFADEFGLDVVRVIGIGNGLYFLARALFQIPVGKFTDGIKSDKDEIWILFIAGFVGGIPFLFYPWVESEYSYYLLQLVFGVGSSMNLNTWRKLFAKNVDKDKEGWEYGFYETVMSIASAILIIAGGVIANISTEYFDVVMVLVGIGVILGGICGGGIRFIKNRKTDLG